MQFTLTTPEIRRINKFIQYLGVRAYELVPYHSYGEQKDRMLDREPSIPSIVQDEQHFKALQRIVLAEINI